MAEVEFKYDERDKQYKLLDKMCVLGDGILYASNVALIYHIFSTVTLSGMKYQPPLNHITADTGSTLTDIPAGIQEIRAGMTTPVGYVHSLLGKTAFSVFAWHDPLPALGDLGVAFSRLTKMLPQKSQNLGQESIRH